MSNSNLKASYSNLYSSFNKDIGIQYQYITSKHGYTVYISALIIFATSHSKVGSKEVYVVYEYFLTASSDLLFNTTLFVQLCFKHLCELSSKI